MLGFLDFSAYDQNDGCSPYNHGTTIKSKEKQLITALSEPFPTAFFHLFKLFIRTRGHNAVELCILREFVGKLDKYVAKKTKAVEAGRIVKSCSPLSAA